jgi:alkylhydroperoxidase/carboxymuconolactone decarboxylase family protein YurZ
MAASPTTPRPLPARGATPGEVAELLGVALLMDGGTASVYAPRAWDAFQEFRSDQATIEAAG